MVIASLFGFGGSGRCKELERLGYSRSAVRRLRRIFNRASSSKSRLSHHDLLMWADRERDAFMLRVFTLFDSSGTGDINFVDFGSSCMTYCTLTHETLSLFAFNLYDADHSGVLEKKEVASLLKDLYSGNPGENAQAQKLLRSMSNCNRAQFQAFCGKHSTLLFPAFNLQRRLHKLVLGRQYWMKKTAKLVRKKQKEEREFLLLERKVLLQQGTGQDPGADAELLKQKEKKLLERKQRGDRGGNTLLPQSPTKPMEKQPTEQKASKSSTNATSTNDQAQQKRQPGLSNRPIKKKKRLLAHQKENAMPNRRTQPDKAAARKIKLRPLQVHPGNTASSSTAKGPRKPLGMHIQTRTRASSIRQMR